MPKPPNKKAVAPEAKKTKLNIQIREIMNDAYAFVLGEKFTASVSSVTLETLMRERIEQIKGTEGKTSIRLNMKDRVERLMDRISQAVTTAKSLPPSAFSLSAEDKTKGNVNTSLEGDEEIPL